MALSYLKEQQYIAKEFVDSRMKNTMGQDKQQPQQQSLPVTPFTGSSRNAEHTASLSSLMAFMNPISFAVLQAQIHQSQLNSAAAASLVPPMYNPHFLPAWPQSAPSPPAALPAGPISPVSHNNNNNSNNNHNHNNNNNSSNVNNKNLTSSRGIHHHQSPNSMDRLIARKKASIEMKKRVTSVAVASPRSRDAGLDGRAPSVGSSASSSGSPEAAKDGPARDKVFTCGVCNRSFGYKHVLQNHERTHTGEKPFECKECHKKFTRDHHLKTHMRLHTGEKPYSCTHCDRQFVQVANLRRHLRVHTGERPYTCDVCNGKFSDSNQLKAHLLIHKDEKPFDCKQCLQRFRRKHHFVQHKCTPVSRPSSNSSGSNSNNNNNNNNNNNTNNNNSSSSASSNGNSNSKNNSGSSSGMSQASPVAGNAMLMSQLEDIGSEQHNEESNGSSMLGGDDADMPMHAHQQRQKAQALPSAAGLPLNLTFSHEAPVQTEPEDLSMLSSRSRAEIRPVSRALSSSADASSPMSQSNSDAEEDEPEQPAACSSPYGIANTPNDR